MYSQRTELMVNEHFMFANVYIGLSMYMYIAQSSWGSVRVFLAGQQESNRLVLVKTVRLCLTLRAA